MNINRQEIATGAIFGGFGAYFAIEALANLPLGTALRMGPGFFPLLLALILIVLGVLIASTGFRKPENGAPRHIPWRGLAVFVLVPIFFGATIRPLGLIPAIALSVFFASFASRRMTLRLAAALSVGMTAFCVAVFHYGLGLPVRLVGNWYYALGF